MSGNAVLPPQDSRTQETLSTEFDAAAGRSLWGYYAFMYDPGAEEPLEVVPVRKSVFHANVRSFLEEMPCTDCLSIENFEYTPDGFNIDISIRHPFSNAPMMYGFDVRGIFFFKGSSYFPESGVKISSPLNGDGYLKNPDGFTRLFNPTEFTRNDAFGYTRGILVPDLLPDPDATIGAFKAYYSEGQSERVGGRRAFAPGDTTTRTYEIAIPGEGPMVFGYAIDACWEPPDLNPPHGIEDFPAEANCPEPFRIDVEVVNNLLTPISGSVTLAITAYDHQDAAGVKVCKVEAPGLIDGIIVNGTPELIDSETAFFIVQIPCETGLASLNGEEILIEIVHEDLDKNFGHVSAWSYIIVDVADVPGTPFIGGIEPDTGNQTEQVAVAIQGSGFHEGIEVLLYKGLSVLQGTEVVVLDHQNVSAVFDLNGPVGLYTLYMENPNGQWSELTGGFEIL